MKDEGATGDAMKRRLEQRLTELLARVGRIERDLRSAHDPDWPERALETENDEVLEGLDEMGLTEVQEIRAALSRIEQGRYGVCGSCGAAISPARLTAIPTAITCLGCASPASS